MMKMMIRAVALCALVLAGASASEEPNMLSSRSNPFVDDPVLEMDAQGPRLVYEHGAAIPRFETDTEREFIANRTQRK